MRNLLLTTPHMKGDDVKTVQHLLGVPEDGEFGPITANACKTWKYRYGFAAKQCFPNLTTGEFPYLAGTYHAGPLMAVRAKARAKAAAQHETTAVKATDLTEHWFDLKLKENPAGSNVVPMLSTFALRAGFSKWYSEMGWPWCGFTVLLSSTMSGGTVFSRDAVKGLVNGLYVPAILAAAKAGQHGLTVVPRDAMRKGDLAIFDWELNGVPDHIGRFLGTHNPGGTVNTVEGNTSYGDGGSQSNGGCVAVRSRPWTNIVAVVREIA